MTTKILRIGLILLLAAVLAWQMPNITDWLDGYDTQAKRRYADQATRYAEFQLLWQCVEAKREELAAWQRIRDLRRRGHEAQADADSMQLQATSRELDKLCPTR